MTSTVAVIGALGGAAICLTGGWIGAKAVLQAAVNDEQRFALKQMLSWGGAYVFGPGGLSRSSAGAL